MEFTFTPTQNGSGKIDVPFFENARADFAPYYRSGMTISAAQAQVSVELGKLGASVFAFQDGTFQAGKVKRYGYNIRFGYGGGQGIIRVAGLPIKSETSIKIAAVKVQALLNVRDWLKTAVTNRVFSPGADILIPFMLVDQTPGHERTVAEYIAEQGHLPQLAATSEVFDGEIVE